MDLAKYDRQFRLWGAEGQMLLHTSKFLVFGTSAVATEISKNLTLGGIGHIHIVDDQQVTQRQIFNNFFVTANDIGKNSAEVVSTLIGELNPDVKVTFSVSSVANFIKQNANEMNQFNYFLACDKTKMEIIELAKYAEQNGKGLLVANSFGLIGYIRLYKGEHLISDSKPDNPVEDLRLNNAFPELLEYAFSFDLKSLDNMAHKHVPYVCILLQAKKIYLEKYQKNPQNFKEKEEFKSIIKSMARDYDVDDNFQEAVSNSYKCFLPLNLPENICNLLKHPNAVNTTITKPFWIMVSALKMFYENEKCLPHFGKIPDMTSDSISYIKLQHIYINKHKTDLDHFKSICLNILKDRKLPSDCLKDEDMKNFISNNLTLANIEYKKISEEYSLPNTLFDISDDEKDCYWYFLVRAMFNYQAKYGQYPGENSDNQNFLSDLSKFKDEVSETIKSVLGTETKYQIEDKFISEMIRMSNSCLHTTGAIVGGLVTQELIKLVTCQFSPVNNTILADLITSKYISHMA